MAKKPKNDQNHQSPQNPLKFRKMTGDLIAVGVLAFGVGAVLGVAYLAYAKLSGDKVVDETIAALPAQVAAIEDGQSGVKSAMRKPCIGCGVAGEAIPAQPLPSQKKLKRPKEKGLSGSWQADFGTSKAFFQISKGAYQLVFVSNQQGQERKYSRGTYDYNEEQGLLVMRPDRNLGEPEPVPGVRYGMLTMRAFGISIHQDKRSGDLYWEQAAVAEERKVTIHPLFLHAKRKKAPIAWQKTK